LNPPAQLVSPLLDHTDAPTCQRCGACCFSPSETYVRLDGADWARLGPDAERVAHFIGNRAYLRMAGGLHGSGGEPGSRYGRAAVLLHRLRSPPARQN